MLTSLVSTTGTTPEAVASTRGWVARTILTCPLPIHDAVCEGEGAIATEVEDPAANPSATLAVKVPWIAADRIVRDRAVPHRQATAVRNAATGAAIASDAAIVAVTRPRCPGAIVMNGAVDHSEGASVGDA